MGFFPLTSVAVGLSSKRWSNTFFTVLLLCYLVFYKTWVCFFFRYKTNHLFATYLQCQMAAIIIPSK